MNVNYSWYLKASFHHNCYCTYNNNIRRGHWENERFRKWAHNMDTAPLKVIKLCRYFQTPNHDQLLAVIFSPAKIFRFWYSPLLKLNSPTSQTKNEALPNTSKLKIRQYTSNMSNVLLNMFTAHNKDTRWRSSTLRRFIATSAY